MRERRAIARAAADRLAAADVSAHRALVGFDGFIDAIIDVVDTRASMAPSDYRRITTISQYAARCAAAAGKSTNLELVVKEERFGGNGPLLAGGLASLGVPTTFIGAVGRPDEHGALHPLYDELARRCAASGGGVSPVAPPSLTHALEFDDGKIMLNDPRHVHAVTWETVCARVGDATLRSLIAGASLIAVVNWSIVPGVQEILRTLASGVLPAARRSDAPRVFVDLSDPAKRSDADIAGMLGTLKGLNARARVTLGLNLAEGRRVDAVARAGAFPRAGEPPAAHVRDAAERLRSALDLECVVIHPREGAAASDASAGSAWFDGPLVQSPRLSTGAGDHFNAGFALGQLLGAPLDEALAVGVAVSGAYVRDARSPSRARLIEFLRDLPMPE